MAYPYIGLSQDIQHYRSIADTTHNDLLKLEALDSVISKSRGTDNDSFIVFSIQYIKLAKEIDSIESAAKKAMNLQYILTTKKLCVYYGRRSCRFGWIILFIQS